MRRAQEAAISSFTVASTPVTFTALETSFSDKGGPLEEITCDILLSSATDWGAMFSLRSWNVSIRPIPGGTVVYVDVSGGAGEGQLTIDNLDAHKAVLTSLTRHRIEPGTTGRALATATWLLTG